MGNLSGAVVTVCCVVSVAGVTLSIVSRRLRWVGFLTAVAGIAMAGWWFLSQWVGDWMGTDRVLYTVFIAGGGAVMGVVLGVTAHRLVRR